MLKALSVAAPVFALIFVGWLARRLGALGEGATRELNRFVIYLALPALLFDIVANARWAQIWSANFAAAFGIACLAVFAATVAASLLSGARLSEASVDGVNAAYSNTGYMGFPLAVAAFGPSALAPTLVATILTVCALFAVAIALIEIGEGREPDRLKMSLKILRTLARNPLIAAPALAAVPSACGLRPPASAEIFLKLLGGAASPCALVALGLFLADSRKGSADPGAVAGLVAGKLLAFPALTWLLATFVFPTPPALKDVAVLMAALPTGTGPFMLAEFYGRRADATSKAILVSTVFSLLTLSAYLATR